MMNVKWDLMQCDGNLLCSHRSSHTSAAHNGCVVLFGGSSTDSGDMDVFDTNCRTWIAIPARSPVPACLYGHSAVTWKGFMVVFGGYNSNEDVMSLMWALAFATLVWDAVKWDRRGGVTPPARHGHTAAVAEAISSMVVIGGLDANDELLGDMWFFNFDSRCWVRMVDHHPALRRAYHTCHMNDDNGVLFLAGGTHDPMYHFTAIDIANGGIVTPLTPVGDGVPRNPWFGHASWAGREGWTHDGGSTDTLGGHVEGHTTLMEWPTNGNPTVRCHAVDPVGFSPSERRGHSATVVGGNVVVFGGQGEDQALTNDFYRTAGAKMSDAASPERNGDGGPWRGVSKNAPLGRDDMLESFAHGEAGAAPTVLCAKRT